ncbi:MAG: dockerin type I repeat-containing protein [Clostridia bacterium]|nr:dockerin type I repeat-containing protein [Clostridia bacterium]
MKSCFFKILSCFLIFTLTLIPAVAETTPQESTSIHSLDFTNKIRPSFEAYLETFEATDEVPIVLEFFPLPREEKTREEIAALYQTYNEQCLNMISDYLCNIEYVTKYGPMVVATATKDNILKLKEIDIVYFIWEGGEIPEPTDNDETTRASNGLLGDIDGDNAVTPADARLALRYSVKLGEPLPQEITIADVDFDGEITASDARLILRSSVGLDKDQ